MDTNDLIAESKARFGHNAAKAYLAEKYNAKLFVAEQGGLWKADQQTIAFLGSIDFISTVMIDTFGNPVQVDTKTLHHILTHTYQEVMLQWHAEYKELENKK